MNNTKSAIEALDEHIDDKNNPHQVTAEQVGARPNTWMPTAADVGALPRDGSAAMTGALTLQAVGATGATLFSDTGVDSLSIMVRNKADDASVARYLQLFNSDGQSDIKEALRLRDRTANGYVNYPILHTGNKNLIAPSDIGAIQIVDITGTNDANNLYVSGKTTYYNIKSSDVANMPVTNWGLLLSMDCGTKRQYYYPDNTDVFYYRTSNGAWCTNGYAYGTSDLTAGSSSLANGKLYFVYE